MQGDYCLAGECGSHPEHLEKWKRDPPRNNRAETDLGCSNSLGEKTHDLKFKLQSSLQVSTTTNVMIKKSFETYEQPSV